MAENLEQKYYTSIFLKTDPAGSGRIEGRQAVALFRTSNIAVPTLKTIWELATPNKEDFLDKNRFFIALKLIALAQEGKPVSLQMIHEKVGLPRFEGIEIPAMPDEWELNENEQIVYVNGFKKLSNEKGFLTAAEARELLQRTNFTPEVLKKIWILIGMNSGNMNIDQFVVAMQLIAKARAGIDVPDTLPGSLDRVLNKKVVKEEPKKQEVRLKDPESHVDAPKPISQPTLGENYESPKKNSTVTVKIDTEKFIREKEKILKEKTSMLKSICELMEVDLTELDLVKEKNKILEEKLKDSQENFEKIKKKVSKSKEKFEKSIQEMSEMLEKLKKENQSLKSRPIEPQAPSKPSEPLKPSEPATIKPEAKPVDRQDDFKIPKKDIGFEFDSFFKDPVPIKPKDSEKPRISDPKPPEDHSKAEANLFSSKPESSFFPDRSSEKFEFKEVKLETRSEPVKAKIESTLFPDFSMKFDAFPAKLRTEDVFADLDSGKIKEPAKEKPRKNSSSSEEPAKKDFQFKFSEDLEKKAEKPLELKPEPMGFNAGFGDFGKAFNFAGGMPSFDDNFFKMDMNPVQSKGSKELDF
jgi:hypothetical protein